MTDTVSLWGGNRLIQRLILATNPISFFNRIYKTIYSIGIKAFLWQFSKWPEVKAIYLRHGMISDDWLPGSSDLDFSIIIEELLAEKEINFLRRFWRGYYSLRFIFPFLGEIRIYTQKELNDWRRFGEITAFEAEKTWQKIYGLNIIFAQYEYVPVKFKLDSLCAAAQSLKYISELYINKGDAKLDRIELRNCYKRCADILKYILYIKNGNKEIIKDRAQFIKLCATKNEENSGMAKRLIALKEANYSQGDKDLLFDILCFSIKYFDETLPSLTDEIMNLSEKKLLSVLKDDGDEGTRSLDSYRAALDMYWKHLSKETKDYSRDCMEAVSLDSGFFIIKNGLSLDDIRKTVKSLREMLLKNKIAAGEKKFLIISKNTHFCLAHTLYSSLVIDYYSKPPLGSYSQELPQTGARCIDGLICMMAREKCATLKFLHRDIPYLYLEGPERFLDFVCGDIPRMRLINEKSVFVARPSLIKTMEIYKKCYPEDAFWLDFFYKRYNHVLKKGKRSVRLKKMIYEARPFIQKMP